MSCRGHYVDAANGIGWTARESDVLRSDAQRKTTEIGKDKICDTETGYNE